MIRGRRVILSAAALCLLIALTVVIHHNAVESRAQHCLSLVSSAMDEGRIVAVLGQPSHRGEWSGSNGRGNHLCYEFPYLWDPCLVWIRRHMWRSAGVEPNEPIVKQIVISFRSDSPTVFEIGSRPAYSHATQVIYRNGR